MVLKNKPVYGPHTWFSAGGLWGWGPGLSPSLQGALYCHESREKNNTTHLAKCHDKSYSIKNSIMLSTTTYLEESRSKVVLNEYAAYTPDITGMVPAQI